MGMVMGILNTLLLPPAWQLHMALGVLEYVRDRRLTKARRTLMQILGEPYLCEGGTLGSCRWF